MIHLKTKRLENIINYFWAKLRMRRKVKSKSLYPKLEATKWIELSISCRSRVISIPKSVRVHFSTTSSS